MGDVLSRLSSVPGVGSEPLKQIRPGIEIIDVSVIIPTGNEFHYLPKLLDSLLAQDRYYPKEIIVADGNSTDGTPEIAATYPRVKVIYGGDHPGKGRNYGAKIAQCELLLFFDGDVALDRDFLGNAYDEIRRRRIEAATVSQVCYNSRHPVDHLFNMSANFAQHVTQYSKLAFGSAMCLFVTRRRFEEVNGFDETVIFSEDYEFIRRVVGKGARWRILNSTRLLVTNRRFVKEGRLRMIKIFIGTAIYSLLVGPDRVNRYQYLLGHDIDIQGNKIAALPRSSDLPG
jgi:glycosyltransferase involved in cell wall biosynthesis